MVVFHYDMIGYADSQGIKHILRSGVPAEDGFADAEAELRLQSLMGLQTWNSIRALDFLESLGDVDPKRLACTGASGGGTQTFLLAAIDDRLAAAFPAVMVSTAMQGGCVCENCSLLRVGTGNIELAGLFAPKPMALSAANDWTKEIATKGAPELKKLYQLLGAESKFAYQAWLEHGHNYNQLAREFMYTWFHEHLLGEKKPITEPKFVPVPPKELSVYDDQHPRPKDELPAHLLRKKLTISSDTQIKSLLPKDAASLEKYHKLISAAVRAMICDELPEKLGVLVPPVEKKYDTVTMHTAVFTRMDEDVALPMSGIFTKEFKDRVVIWIHPKGKASLRDQDTIAAPALTLVKAGYAVVAPDLLGVGDLALPSGYEVSKIYAGFTYGYNRSLFAHRVHDILTAICFAQSMLGAKTIHLVGWGSFGPHAVVARAAVGKVITKMAADLNQFRFESITKTDDPMLLPGAVKYGGVPAFLAAAAPLPALVHNLKGIGSLDLPKQAYAISGSDFQRSNLPLAEGKVVEWLLQG
jgi:dienelactone hydrolase